MPISQTLETNQVVLPIVHCGSSMFSLNTPKIKSFFFNFLGYIYIVFSLSELYSIKSAFMNNNKFCSLTVTKPEACTWLLLLAVG